MPISVKYGPFSLEKNPIMNHELLLNMVSSTFHGQKKINNRAAWNKRAVWIFFWKSNKWAGEKVSKRRTISDNFGSEFAVCTIWDDMYSLPKITQNKSCFECSSSMCLFKENQIKASIGGKTLEINKRACSFIQYLRIPWK